MKFEWKAIFSNSDSSQGTLRAKVIGGWLVRHITWADESDNGVIPVSTAMVFVPDEFHEWELE